MTTASSHTSLPPDELRRRQSADDELMVVDVRTPVEFESVHIRGSYNVPLDLLSEHTHDLAERMRGHVVLICQSGNRAGQACQELGAAEFDTADVLEGGIAAYEATGGEVVRQGSLWAMDRQVRMTAGSLVLLGGPPMSEAVGTSLLVIALKSLAGVAGYLTTTVVDWPLVLALTAMAVAGSLIGVRLQSRIPEDALRHGFGWFVIGMGVLVLALELPGPTALAVLVIAGLALAAVLACRLAPAGSLPCPAAWGRGILDVPLTKEST